MKIEIKVLTAVRLTKLFIAASRWLSKYADVLNDLNVYGGVNAGLPISFHYKDKTFGIRYDITGRTYVGTEYKGFTAEIGGGYPGYARLGLGYSF